MNYKLLHNVILSFSVTCGTLAAAQPAPPSASAEQGAPVSYASVTEVNGLLSQLENTSKTTQNDLGKLRIDKWKTDGAIKKESLSRVESIQRNLQGALPEVVAQVQASPEDLAATFKLYRNLDALYDVLGDVVQRAGAFASKDDYQSLANDLNSFEGTRKQFAERMQNLATSKEAEITRLRTDLRAAQAAVAAAPPKKTVVDDTEPPKKAPVKKKPAAKKPAPAQPTQNPQ